MIKGLHVTGDHVGSTSPSGFNDQDAPTIAKSCGAVMIPVVWPDIQPTATSGYDATLIHTYADRVALAHRLGLRVVLGIGELPSWIAQPGWGPADLTVTGPWAKWVKMVLETFPVWAVCPLNETNVGWKNDPRGAAQVTAKLIEVAVAQREGIEHAAQVWAPCALNSVSFVDRVLRLVGPNVEFPVAHHPYAKGRQLTSLFECLEHHKRSPVVHVTEFGVQQPTLLVAAQWQLAPAADLKAALVAERTYYNWCAGRHSDTRQIGSFFHYQNRIGNISWFTALYNYDGTLTPLGEAYFTGGTGIA